MRPTSGTSVGLGLILGGAFGWVGQWLLVATGNPALVPPLTWGGALAALGAIAMALAWPIRKRVKKPALEPPIDPFYATRVVLLAKAGAIAGSALTGIALGFLVFVLSRPVMSSSALWPTIVALVGALVLTVGALLAERWCAIPPDSPEHALDEVPEGEIP